MPSKHQPRGAGAEAVRLPRFPKASQGQKPARVDFNDESVVAVSCGEHHTLAVTEWGDVCSFGRGKEGQLGNGEASRNGVDLPCKVEALANETVVSVACGAYHSLAVTSSGRLYEWGLIHTEPVSLGPRMSSADAELLALAGPSQGNVTRTGSYLHSVVADSARRWLSATDRDRMEEDTSDEDVELDEERVLMQSTMLRRLPTRNREAIPRLARSLLRERVVSASAGFAHSIAVTDRGRAFATGQNDRGQLGLGHRIHSGVFREVLGMRDRFICQVACGEQHNVARALAKGMSSSSADASAELYVWGGGQLGQLGLGAATVRFAPTYNSLLCGGGGGVVSVGAGANHSACVLANGRVFSWGHAEYNQQGIAVVAGADLMGDQDVHGYFRVPRLVRGLVGTHVVSVCCGSNFTLVVDSDGVAHSFGWNEGDALGRHGVYDPSPRPVPSLPPIIGISAGSTHSCAITGVGPALGRHLCSLVDGANDDSANVELLAPDAARRGDRGVPVHMCIVSVRCPYLTGHIEAALKHSSSGDSRILVGAAQQANENDRLPTVALCLEHATADTVRLLVFYLYTDEIPSDGVSGEMLGTLGGLAKELLLPRLEGLCVERLPYSIRRRYKLQNAGRIPKGLPSEAAAVPESTFVAELGNLAGSARHSDVVLIVPEWGWKFYCHKVILCSAPWWRALLKGGFREGGGDTMDMSGILQEGVTRPAALEVAVRHAYTSSDALVVDMDPSVVMEVVILAEYMVLPSLLRACQRELANYVDASNAGVFARFADKYHMFKLENLCKELLNRNRRHV